MRTETKGIVESLTSPALIHAVEQNALEGCRACRAWPDMELCESPNLVWTMTSIPAPLFNTVVRTRISQDEIEFVVDEAIGRARQRRVPMAWWVGPSDEPADLGPRLRTKGFFHAQTLTGMAVDLSALSASHPAPTGVSIERVRDAQSLRLWCDVLGSVFEFPECAWGPMFEMYSAAGFDDRGTWQHFIGRLCGAPVATASLCLGGGVAGLACVATLPDHRRRGVGTAMTLEVLRRGHELGYRVGVLYSSETAYSLYRRLGFQQLFQAGLYIWAGDPS